MKTTLNINGEEVEITLTDEQIEAITKASNNKFDIDYENRGHYIDYDGSVYTSDCLREETKAFGIYRKTEKLAQKASDAMRARNKLEELVHWLEPEWEADWGNKDQEKCYLYYDNTSYLFSIAYRTILRNIGTVHMSKQTANKIRNALNDGKLPELKEILFKGQ